MFPLPTSLRSLFLAVVLTAAAALLTAGCTDPFGLRVGGTETDESVETEDESVDETARESPSDDTGGATGATATADPTPRVFWGSWTRLDSAESWYISDSTVTVGSSVEAVAGSTSSSISLADGRRLDIVDERTIRVSDAAADREVYLYRARAANIQASATMALVNATTSSKSLGGFVDIGGIDVILRNSENPSDEQVVSSGSDGSVEMTDLIRGDSYTVEYDDPASGSGVSVDFVAEFDQQNVGTLPLTDTAYRLDVAAVLESTSSYRYARYTPYTITIDFTNIGTERFLAPQLTITGSEYLTITSVEDSSGFVSDSFSVTGNTLTSVVRSMDAGVTRSVTLNVLALPFPETQRVESLSFELVDYDGNTWSDSAEFLFFQDDALIDVDGNVNAALVLPDGNTMRLAASDTTAVPRMTGDYYFVVSGATADTEDSYSFAVDRQAPSRSGFTGVSAHEPNNDFNSATTVVPETGALSYVVLNDIDYYTFSFDTTVASFAPTAAVAVGLDETSGSGDGVANPGEELALDVRLYNYGDASLALTGTLSTSSPYVTISGGDTVEFSLGAGEYDTLTDTASAAESWVNLFNGGVDSGVAFSVAADAPAGHAIPFTLTMTDQFGLVHSASFEVPVEGTFFRIMDTLPSDVPITIGGVPFAIGQGETVSVSVNGTTTYDAYQWFIDGSAIAGTAGTTAIEASQLDTGYHRLTARVTDGPNVYSAHEWFFVVDDVASFVDIGWIDLDRTIESPNYPANYPDDYDASVTVTKPGATAVRVRFSAFSTYSPYDVVELIGADGTVAHTYSGDLGGFTSDPVAGDTVTVRFRTNGYSTKTGWQIDRVEFYR